MRRPIQSVCLLVVVLTGVRASQAQPNPIVRLDSPCDAMPRRTDPGGDAPFNPVLHRLAELRETRIGRWTPQNPRGDVFIGTYNPAGQFVRLDVVLTGRMNPPGPTRPQGYAPFLYGEHPVYGFVEIDMDVDNLTGGELEQPALHYLGNVARFGGVPSEPVFAGRVARSRAAFDGNFTTPPWVERHGEEFHLALLGEQFVPQDITFRVGDNDLTFEAGEVWQIAGKWFHRAHGFEPYSLAKGGGRPGEYMPVCVVQFAHVMALNATTISLVFPLTNAGAAQVRGEPVEPPNHDPSDQASALEALDDLVISAQVVDDFGTGEPEEQIILGWKDKIAGDYIVPMDWRPTVMLGSTYTVPDPLGMFFVWSDIHPNVLRGDMDGDGVVNLQDVAAILGFIADFDGIDGRMDGEVELADFADDFSVFDVNQNGLVNPLDAGLARPVGDGDDGRDVDLADFAGFQACFPVPGDEVPEPCGVYDLNDDGFIDLIDVDRFACRLTGPLP